jgi:hypothetical protein
MRPDRVTTFVALANAFMTVRSEVPLAIWAPPSDLTVMKIQLTIASATILAMFAFQAEAQTRPPRPEPDERIMRDLGHPKYQPNSLADRSIRQENETLRNRLLLPGESRPLSGTRSYRFEK